LAFSFSAGNAECYSARMNSPMAVYLFRDSLPSRSNTVVCVRDRERIEAAFGGGQLAVLFKGEVVYRNDTTNRAYLGVWGSKKRIAPTSSPPGAGGRAPDQTNASTKYKDQFPDRSEVSVGLSERARGSPRSFAKNAQDFGRRIPRAKDARSRLLSASSCRPFPFWDGCLR
jgi:hypothetical protein